MRGADGQNESQFSKVRLEQFVPQISACVIFKGRKSRSITSSVIVVACANLEIAHAGVTFLRFGRFVWGRFRCSAHSTGVPISSIEVNITRGRHALPIYAARANRIS